jgi:hypothetical protein
MTGRQRGSSKRNGTGVLSTSSLEDGKVACPCFQSNPSVRTCSGTRNGQLSLTEHRVKHGASQFPCKRILLTGVIRTEQRHAPRQTIHDSMAKLGHGRWDLKPFSSTGFEIVVESDLPQRHHRTDFPKKPQLLQQEPATVFKFIRRRFISWRRTAHGGPDVAIGQCQSIVSMGRGRLIGKSMPIQYFIQPIPASIASKNPSCPIPAVSSWSKSQHIQPCARVAEARDRTSPIGPVQELAPFCLCDPTPIGHKPCAGRAIGNRAVQNNQRLHRGW